MFFLRNVQLALCAEVSFLKNALRLCIHGLWSKYCDSFSDASTAFFWGVMKRAHGNRLKFDQISVFNTKEASAVNYNESQLRVREMNSFKR